MPDKTAEQIFAPLIKASVNYLEVVGYCPQCKSQIEKDIAKRIFERIEESGVIVVCNIPECECRFCKWWQQFKKEFTSK